MSRLITVTYHYVRDLPRTRFPRIRGLTPEDLRRQVGALAARCEMATWDSLLAFLGGEYRPARDLCYLTFDDGLRDHHRDVLPILAERRLSGAFFLITAAVEDGQVASAHKNHFLMAELGFDELQRRFEKVLAALADGPLPDPPEAVVRAAYPWDETSVGRYKYLVNHALPLALRERVLDALFDETFGDERAFARELYMGWEEVAALRRAGMTLGGHSHRHRALAALPAAEQAADLAHSRRLLRERCPGLTAVPFCYPYGLADSFTDETAALVRAAGFAAAFSVVPGWITPPTDRFRLHRVDTKDVLTPAWLGAA